MSGDSTIVETRDLTIGYMTRGRASVIMDHLSLSARQGELVALIGRNGTGKSTLLRTLVALQSPLGGTIRLQNRNISAVSTDLPKVVSFTSTEPVAVRNIKVREVVALGRFPYTNWIGSLTSDDHHAVREALDVTGMLTLGDRIIDTLSDGERQRTLIARSLAQDTGLLIMDEPTAFLDLPSRYSIVSLLKKLTREKGKCVIYSTHDLDTAINEADMIWLMTEKGVTQGAPEDLMLSNAIARAFESSLISFSQTGGTFSFVSHRQRSIALEAEGIVRTLTEKALNRYGYRIDQSSALKVVVKETGNSTEWMFINGRQKEFYTSLYDLLGHLPDEA
jgi:iron complex transport system ATP-binding protein